MAERHSSQHPASLTASRTQRIIILSNTRYDETMGLARITITLARDLLAAADRRAKELQRSRSWVVAEALRRYLARPSAVREQVAGPHEPSPAGALGNYRRAQLEADLALTPEQRVREAERTARVPELAGRKRPGHRVLIFDRYEDYLEWKRWEGVAPR